MYVTLYKYTNQVPPGNLHSAKPFARKAFRVNYIRNYIAHTHNARLKSRFQCTRLIATGLQKP